jgi:hypothetical protein
LTLRFHSGIEQGLPGQVLLAVDAALPRSARYGGWLSKN